MYKRLSVRRPKNPEIPCMATSLSWGWTAGYRNMPRLSTRALGIASTAEGRRGSKADIAECGIYLAVAGQGIQTLRTESAICA